MGNRSPSARPPSVADAAAFHPGSRDRRYGTATGVGVAGRLSATSEAGSGFWGASRGPARVSSIIRSSVSSRGVSGAKPIVQRS